MTQCNTTDRAKSPNDTNETNQIPSYAEPIIAEAEIDDQKFDAIFAVVSTELLEEIETGLASRFKRMMIEKYVADETVSDFSFDRAMKQIHSASIVLEEAISSAIEEEIALSVNAGPSGNLNVSIAQELRNMDW
ncbi:MAG: hypothetical protein AAGB13_15995 [Cyanobacteria bacterium P01_F01_bin.33]